MNIQESNKLIAEFMGLRQGHPDPLETRWENDWFEPDSGIRHTHLHYDEWNWLMPVVDKIHNTGVVTDICFGYDMGYFTIEAETEQETRIFEGHQNHGKPIDCVYKAVIEFIQWYNDHN